MKDKFIKIKDSISEVIQGLVVVALLVWAGYLFCTSSDHEYYGPGGPICSSYYDEIDEEEIERSAIEYLQSKGYVITDPLALL